jgi:hypothetical protein
MVKFEITDDAVLRLSGVGTGLYAASHLFAPRQTYDSFFDNVGGISKYPYNSVLHSYTGLGYAGVAAAHLSVAEADLSYSAKKNLLKASGAGWVAAAALNVYHASNSGAGSGLKKDVLYGAAAVNAAIGALCLWRGYETLPANSKRV